jgi:hypothetical protein
LHSDHPRSGKQEQGRTNECDWHCRRVLLHREDATETKLTGRKVPEKRGVSANAIEGLSKTEIPSTTRSLTTNSARGTALCICKVRSPPTPSKGADQPRLCFPHKAQDIPTGITIIRSQVLIGHQRAKVRRHLAMPNVRASRAAGGSIATSSTRPKRRPWCRHC